MTSFSASYAEARQRFRVACQVQGVETWPELLPDRRGPDDEELAIDFAWAGPRDARGVLLLLVGTHGYEAYAGSACVLQWLEDGGAAALPADTAVAIAHGLNPWGWAHDSRFNEDFVDLNRNWIDFAALPPANPVFAELHALMTPAALDEDRLQDTVAAIFGRLARAEDKAAVLQAVTGGQYSHPDGLNYGGSAPSWSRRALEGFIQTHMDRAAEVVAIDFHTGLGPHGQPFMVCLHAPGSAAEARAHALWGREALTHESFYDNGEAAADYQGLLLSGLEQHFSRRQQSFTGVVVEWGTYGNDVVLGALIADRWLRFACHDRATVPARRLAQQMRHSFDPPQSSWRAAVLGAAQPLICDTLQGMGEVTECRAPQSRYPTTTAAWPRRYGDDGPR